MTAKNTSICIILLFVVLAGLNCKSTHGSASQKAAYKSIYTDQFKLTYFRQMLIKGYNNSNAIREIISSDHSGFTEPILTDDDYTLIDSLTTVDNEKMKIDSTGGSRRAEGAQGKRPLRFVIEKITDKWLDSIANERYKLSGNKAYYHK
ncbi:MAG: hypothetical protein QM802_12225 [Agriterribacter sp.]